MDADQTFRAVVALTVVPIVAIMAYHRWRAATGEKISRREEGFWIGVPVRLLGLASWIGMAIYLIHPSWMDRTTVDLPIWMRWLGAALGVLAVPLVYWVASSLGLNITDTVVTRERHTLVKHGPYRWVRHPLYSTAFLLLVSISLAAASWFFAATLLPAFALLVVRTRKEEQNLVARFGGAYRDYMSRTGRFVPRFRNPAHF